MRKVVLMECIVVLLVLLFVYAGSSKLLDMKGFRAGMMLQPFDDRINQLLATVLPFAELLICLGFIFKRSRTIALYAYTFLMLCFTGYTALVVAGFFKHTPCGCGGIINHLSWTGHLIINIIFLLLSGWAIVLNRQTKLVVHNQEVSRKPVTE